MSVGQMSPMHSLAKYPLAKWALAKCPDTIVRALAIYHDIIISEKHVKRILKSMGLYRRKNYSDITDVIDFIEQQLKESGKQHLFYRGHR